MKKSILISTTLALSTFIFSGCATSLSLEQTNRRVAQVDAKLVKTQAKQDEILAETEAAAVKEAKDEAAKLKETQVEDAKKLAELQESQSTVAEQVTALNEKLSLTGVIALREAHLKMEKQLEEMSKKIAELESSKVKEADWATSIGNSAALGGKNEVLLRNNLVYRPKLDFGKTKIAGTGVSTNEQVAAAKKTNLKASVFNGLTKPEQAALCDAIDNACKKAGADMLMDPVWTFKETEEKKLVCEVVGRPAFVVGYDAFSLTEVMQEYVDFIEKNKLGKKEVVKKIKNMDGSVTEEVIFEKFMIPDLLELVAQGEMGNLGEINSK